MISFITSISRFVSGWASSCCAGALTIARWRVVGLVLATLFIGAVGFGYLYDLLSLLGIL